MKFKAFQMQDGKWAVKTHVVKGVPRGLIFDNELEAKQYALKESMKYYQSMVDEAWDELCRISETNGYGEVRLEGGDDFYNKGDFLS